MRRLGFVVLWLLAGCGGTGKKALAHDGGGSDASAAGPSRGGGLVGDSTDAASLDGAADVGQLADMVPTDAPPVPAEVAPPPPDSAPALPDAGPNGSPPLPFYASAWPGMDDSPYPPIPDPMAPDKCEDFIAAICSAQRACPGVHDREVLGCVQERRAELGPGGCKRVAAISDRITYCTGRLGGAQASCPDGGLPLPATCNGMLILRP